MYNDRGGNTQVKTYTDHGNGHSAIRTGNSSHYSKVSTLHLNNTKVFLIGLHYKLPSFPSVEIQVQISRRFDD